jgi:CBS domain-containing protein
MPAPQPLDLSLYVTAPRLSVPAAVSLGIALLSAAPKPAPQTVRRAATRLRESVLTLQQDWRRQLGAGLGSLVAPRDADSRVDRAMRAMSMRLEALTLLSASAGPDVEAAESAYQRLFPDGLRFLTLPYAQQWAHCDRLLSTLDEDEELAADVERLVGETTLAEVRAAQAAYGDALGITTARETTDAVSLAEPLDAVRNAIVSYALQVIAMQSDDPSRLAAARKALAPIDELRAAQATQGRRSESTPATPTAPTAAPEGEVVTVTPDTPVPVIEDEPTASA